MQIRSEIEVLPADEKKVAEDEVVIDPKNTVGRKKDIVRGWTVSETIGIAIVNPRAATKLIKK